MHGLLACTLHCLALINLCALYPCSLFRDAPPPPVQRGPSFCAVGEGTVRPNPLPISPDVQGSLLWLEANTPWDAVIEHWKITSPFPHSFRRNPVRAPNGAVDSIQQMINKFKPLQSGNGYDLLDCDFKVLYPAKGMCLFQEWSTLAAFLEQEIKIRDPNFTCEEEEMPCPFS
ncbi:hypothetical protein FOCC_FOCC009619 [Frankliniella occidentalis]|nr:hypothetical protein FOCC_FOCC009619 [Frankliniella occidentalis]